MSWHTPYYTIRRYGGAEETASCIRDLCARVAKRKESERDRTRRCVVVSELKPVARTTISNLHFPFAGLFSPRWRRRCVNGISAARQKVEIMKEIGFYKLKSRDEMLVFFPPVSLECCMYMCVYIVIYARDCRNEMLARIWNALWLVCSALRALVILQCDEFKYVFSCVKGRK